MIHELCWCLAVTILLLIGGAAAGCSAKPLPRVNLDGEQPLAVAPFPAIGRETRGRMP